MDKLSPVWFSSPWNKSFRARTTHLFVPSVCHQFCRKTPGGAKRQGGRRLTRGRPRLVLREEIFAWSRRPRSRAAGGSKDGSNLQRQTASFSSRSLAAESTPRTSDQPWSARGRDPPGCCESRTAPASSAASFAWATSAPPPRATQLRRRWRREVFFCSWSWLFEYSKDKHVQRSTYYCTRRSMWSAESAVQLFSFYRLQWREQTTCTRNSRLVCVCNFFLKSGEFAFYLQGNLTVNT